jgi:hypothetical protein
MKTHPEFFRGADNFGHYRTRRQAKEQNGPRKKSVALVAQIRPTAAKSGHRHLSGWRY